MLDRDFLKQLDEHREKEVWAKIIALTSDEEPVEEITGEISGGDIGLDGSSSVRRTCSLQMVAKDININNYYWGLKNKFKLEIGLTNRIDPRYPDIIWFPQGTYVITNFSTSHTINNYNISIQGQDKMCLLNGTVGGSLTALSYKFDDVEEEEKETDSIIIKKIPIRDIIRSIVHEYAGEPYQNIIVNDLDEKGLELLEYTQTQPMWMFIGTSGENTDMVVNTTRNKNTVIYVVDEDVDDGKLTLEQFDIAICKQEGIKLTEEQEKVQLPEWLSTFKLAYDSRVDALVEEAVINPTIVRKSEHAGGIRYTLWKITKGETVGYRTTDIIYPGDLIESVGTPVTQVLDKLKNMLGNFEYFYDDDGRFIFQKKKIYIDESWNTIQSEGDNVRYVENAAYSSASEYTFEGNRLISSFSNSPNLNNVRNDFSIWGTRKSVTGNEIPVHLRYAIDKKPMYYKTLEITKDTWAEIAKERKNKELLKKDKVESKIFYTADYQADENAVDWRELIYQMAMDYRRFGDWSSFNIEIDRHNRLNGEPLYLGGQTGYQQYYTDMEGFWRQLYNPNIKQDWLLLYSNDPLLKGKSSFEELLKLEKNNENLLQPIEEDISVVKEKLADENLSEEDRKKYQKILNDLLILQKDIPNWRFDGWNEQVIDEPEMLNFWFDFINIDGELAQFSIPAIGHRPKAINDNDVKSIYFKETPLVVFVKADNEG